MATRGHRFLVTVESIEDDKNTATRMLVFEHENHDDIIDVAVRVRERSGLAPDDAAATAIGLKLLGEAMLRAKHDPLFDLLRAPILLFIKTLKGRVASNSH
jgi:Domain of Unknown Function with PDB structure (DUF3861)